MTSRMDLFSNIYDNAPYLVSLPHGDQTNAIKEDTVVLDHSLILRHALRVPQFFVNLTYVVQLMSHSNSLVTFSYDIWLT